MQKLSPARSLDTLNTDGMSTLEIQLCDALDTAKRRNKALRRNLKAALLHVFAWTIIAAWLLAPELFTAVTLPAYLPWRAWLQEPSAFAYFFIGALFLTVTVYWLCVVLWLANKRVRP